MSLPHPEGIDSAVWVGSPVKAAMPHRRGECSSVRDVDWWRCSFGISDIEEDVYGSFVPGQPGPNEGMASGEGRLES